MIEYAEFLVQNVDSSLRSYYTVWMLEDYLTGQSYDGRGRYGKLSVVGVVMLRCLRWRHRFCLERLFVYH
jgi:hypothetical protein